MSPSNKKFIKALAGAPKLVIATVALMEELIRVMKLEIELVTTRKVKEHPEILKYKQRLAMDYRANMKAIAGQPDMMKKLSDDAKGVLREVAKMLAKAVDENARIMGAAVSATQQLIQNIVAMVKKEAMPRTSYNNPHKSHLQLGKYSPTCQPVAIRQSV